MSVCINCGKISDGCLCNDCRTTVNIEELCSRILEYKPGSNELWDKIADSMYNSAHLRYYVFELAGGLPSPKKEYYRILSMGSAYEIQKDSRKWLYNVYDNIKDDLHDVERNVIRGYLLFALFRDYKYNEAEELISEITGCENLPVNTCLALTDYYNITRRYNMSEYYISQIENVVTDTNMCARLDKLKTDLERYKSGKEYMPCPTLNREQVRQSYIDFLSKLGIKAEMPIKAETAPEPIPRDEYPLPFEIRDSDFSKYTVFALTPVGKDPVRDCVVEIAAVKMEDDVIKGEFSTLIKPYKVGFDRALSFLYNVTPDELKTAKNMWNVFVEFMDFLGDDVLVSFDVINDVKYLTRMGRYSHIIIQNKIFDIKHFSGTDSLQELCSMEDIGVDLDCAKDRAMAAAMAFAKIRKNNKERDFGSILDDIDNW